MLLDEIIKGAMVCSGLIIAIGAQNLFVLKQGLLKSHIFWVALICFVCDFVLISIGVFGFGGMISQSELATKILALLGSLFLIWYGCRSFRSAYSAKSYINLDNQQATTQSLKTIVLSTFAITLLNPHVYLDTVVIIGSITGSLQFEQKVSFLIGALSVSCIWFFGLGYGTRLLIPLFKQKKMWVILDSIVGCIMFYIAFDLFSNIFL